MYYRGSRTSLNEKFTPARTAKSVYSLRFGGPRKERQKEVSLFFKWEGDKKRKSGTAGKPAITFYRPGVTTVEDTPAYSEKKKSWVRQSPSHRRILLALKIGGLALLVVAVVWSKNKTTALLQDIAGLKLERVSVDGNHYLAGDEVIQAAALPLGESMFKLDLNKAVERVQKMDWVQRVFIERRLPRSIVVSVRERKPVALLENGSLYGVDHEGMILSSSPVLLREDLPLISGLRVQADAVGTTEMAESLQPALDFLQFLEKKDQALARDVSEINLSEPGCLKVTFIDGVEALFAPPVEETDLKRLALTLGDLTQKGKQAKTVDFRFRDIVLVKTR